MEKNKRKKTAESLTDCGALAQEFAQAEEDGALHSMADLKQKKLEELQSQMELFAVVRAHHLKLAKDAANDETANIHLEIAALFLQVMDRYHRLMKNYH